MHVHVIPSGPIETNAYLLTETSQGEAVLIDAPGGIWAQVEPILARDQLTLRELWLTHGHWDHTQGGAEVVRRTGARVRAHCDDRMLIETPEVMNVFLRGLTLEPIGVDQWVGDGETWSLWGRTVEVRHVPGHCPGNILFYIADAAWAAVGDAIFAGSVGRTDLPGGSMAVLERSIRDKIYTLPAATRLHPGHGPATTVATERATNPYVHD
jgi:hydroxyacylglutathione hydrolase